MSKSYGNWAYNAKAKVLFKCKYDCEKKHDHFVGKYEDAIKYFTGGQIEMEKGYGDLIDIVIFYQLNDDVITRTSAELYYQMMDAAATKKYWIPAEHRQKYVMEKLKQAEKLDLIKDEEILRDLRKSGKKRSERRIYRQEKWVEDVKIA